MRRTTHNGVKRLLIGCFLLLAACGQKTEQETAITNTVTPTVTLAPTATPIPEPTATPSPTPMIDIPLSEEYFPDMNFRTYLYEYERGCCCNKSVTGSF